MNSNQKMNIDICREILAFLDTTSILKCSIVNKLFN